MKHPIVHTDIKGSKDAKGYTIYCTATIAGKKVRLRKRVKEDDFDDIKEYWEKLLKKGLNPLVEEEEKQYHNLTTELTVTEALQRFNDGNNHVSGTTDAFKNKIGLLEKDYGDYLVNQITPLHLEEVLLKKIKSGDWSQSTIKHAYMVFSTFFNYCVKAKFCPENPVHFMNKRLKAIKDAKARYVPFSDEHMPLIMDEIRRLRGTKGDDVYLLVNLIYHGCIRVKEARHLKVGDFDLDKNEITIRGTVSKTRTLGVVPIFPALREVLLDYEIDRRDKTESLFRRNSTSRFRKYFVDILEYLELENEGYSLYCFKHTSCVHKVIKNKWQPHQIQKLCRHSSLAMTMEYLKKLDLFTDFDNVESTAI
ncbi:MULTISPECIES: tyrosine-type recombinase/integrase [Sphingobacterium]|uniref:tyrosine-type recombinase/integrase n=1 Tax=Sphingobacterium TaxID=28453 RepID=UPI0013D988C2|nr:MULTISPECIES: tyrosine-type recombinase/integrase [unclassified Sphingobacterium]